MNKLLNFLSYHNAVPIALGILFLGAGGALAASPDVRDSVYSSEVVVQSVDNTRIVNANIELYPFTLTVTGVSEDQDAYYVDYSLQTIEINGGVWQDLLKQNTLTVSKALLGGRDLGLFATQQLAEVRDRERSRLLETQTIERGLGASQKVVATVYSGLVGALLDPATETFPAYVPVVTQPTPTQSGGGAVGSSADTVPPALSVVGQNPARIFLNSVYTDEGVIVVEDSGQHILEVLLDEVVVESIELDTTRVRAYIITYRATDGAGNSSSVTREIVVDGDGPAPAAPAEASSEGTEPEPEETATTTATTTEEIL